MLEPIAAAALALSSLGTLPLTENTDDLFALWRDGAVRNVHGVAIGESTTASMDWTDLSPQVFEALRLALARGAGGLSGVGLTPPATFVPGGDRLAYRYHLAPLSYADNPNLDFLPLDISLPEHHPFSLGATVASWKLGVTHRRSTADGDRAAGSLVLAVRVDERFDGFPYEPHINDAPIDAWRVHVGGAPGRPGGTYELAVRSSAGGALLDDAAWTVVGTLDLEPGAALHAVDVPAGIPSVGLRIAPVGGGDAGLIVAHVSGATSLPGHRVGLYPLPGQTVSSVSNADVIAAQTLVFQAEAPDWFAVNFGINDGSERTGVAEFGAAMAAAYDRLSAAAPDAIPLVVSTLIAPGTLYADPIKLQLQRDYNDALYALASSRGWAWIDVNQIMQGFDGFWAGVHLGPGGSAYLADHLEMLVTGNITPTPVVCASDGTGDGRVDVFDFALFAERFGSAGAGPEDGDFNGDGRVDVFDFGVLAGEFGCDEGAG